MSLRRESDLDEEEEEDDDDDDDAEEEEASEAARSLGVNVEEPVLMAS